MKRFVNTCLFLFLSVGIMQGQETGEFIEVDKMPSFPGGINEMYKFISENLEYPPVAREKNISGTVFITFIVEDDGSISSSVIKKDIGGGCGDEALRVVNAMPRWEPAEADGKPTRMQMTLPVSFKLAGEKPEPDEEFDSPVEAEEWEVVEEQAEEEEIFVIVEQAPEFPGGMEAMMQFLAENIRYPAEAREAGITGKVIIAFVVETDGQISNVEILRDIGYGCGEEAKRVVESMPKWIPGYQRGDAVRVQFHLPVQFTLQDDRKKNRKDKIKD